MFKYILPGHEEHLEFHEGNGVWCDYCNFTNPETAHTEFGEFICENCADGLAILEEVEM